MHRTARVGTRCITKIPARIIAGRRLASPWKPNLQSAPARSISFTPGFPWKNDSQDQDAQQAEQGPRKDEPTKQAPVDEKQAESSVESGTGPSPSSREKTTAYGSAARRWQRNRRPKDIPPITIPPWFLERNVLLKEEAVQNGVLTEGSLELMVDEADDSQRSTRYSLSLKDHTLRSSDAAPANEATGKKLSSSSVLAQDFKPECTPEHAQHDAGQDQPSSGDSKEHEKTASILARRYTIDNALMNEVIATISGCLYSSQIDPAFAESFPIAKSHLKLHCPIDGGTYFLDKVVEHASLQLGADIVRIDAQDLAEIAGDYIKEGIDASGNSLWTLGYDTQQLFPKASQAESLEEPEEEGDEDEDADAEDLEASRKGVSSFAIALPSSMSGVKGGSVLPSGLRDLISQISKNNAFASMGSSDGSRPAMPRNNMPGLIQVSQPTNGSQQWDDFKLTHLLESLLEANQHKRIETAESKDISQAPQAETSGLPAVSEPEADITKGHNRPPWPLPRTIVHIRNFKELSSIPKGVELVDRLLDVAQRKRRDGQPIAIVGTTSSSDLTPEISKAGFEGLQSESPESFYRNIVVTPHDAGPHGGLFYHDESSRNFEMNIRHLRDMVRRFDKNSSKAPRDLIDSDQDRSESLKAALEERPLTFDEVHRVAVALVGTKAITRSERSRKAMFKSQDVLDAIELLSLSDRAKTRWAIDETGLRAEQERPPMDSVEKPKKSTSEKRIAKIKKQCNKYEKRLLNGVIDPENLRTTFADVHAPVETITSLKMLTTLSLLRPDAFKYGVLATDKITGALLYGPPGTGKTLLAKAVAKESGATVLEVSGSDIYDMYVGEGEKNVRAVFSLAKKLSPCVVFIDEADAIFASRGTSTSRNSHRELINQFLREWDGMVDTTAFIMVATNRPFDLDDAALRRLPRRLLVDLPDDKDRASILKIHLKDEKLDSAVSIEKLAAETKLYSGSDLKNLAVAAALSAVREENDEASKYRANGSEEEYEYPERRILHQRHFDKALDEITASVSEDMGSLKAIRKFDEKYGDKRGKKKKPGYGFQTGASTEKDTNKVRS